MDLRARARALRGRRLVAVAAAVLAVVIAGGVGIARAASPAPVTTRSLMISVTDGPAGNQHVRLDATFFTPPGTGRVPAILLAHGFGETKDSVRPEALTLARAGFAVLTWSARGFGKSTGQIALDAPDYEVKDVEQLVTWLARQPRVRLNRPGDPDVGITGASYGGAIALLAAAYDHRIDAVVPVSTWNNLATALFPDAAGGGPLGGVFKKQWAGLLFTQGVLSGASPASGDAGPGSGGRPGSGKEPANPCGRFLPSLCALYEQAATLGRATPGAVATLLADSPASVAARMTAPTLLIQGEHDSLFGLDQADASYREIRRNGAPAAMVWFAGGHDGGNQETDRVSALAIGWFDRYLAPGAAAPATHGTGSHNPAPPGFSVSRNLRFDASSGQAQLAVATAGRYPGLAGTRQALVRLAGPAQPVINPPGGAPPSFSTLPGVGGIPGLAIDMPGQSAAFTSPPLAGPVQVTGAPTVRVRVSGAPTVTLFAELYDVDQAGNALLPFSLAAPLRVAVPPGGSAVVTVKLPAIDYQFAAGHRLRLVLTSTDFGYATPAALAVYRVGLAGPSVRLPEDPALVVTSGGLPWWTWGAPLAAALAAAVIVVTGRRRRGGRAGRPASVDSSPAALDDRAAALAGRAVPDGTVPLDITGLTKRFKDGHLAVDGLSLRVERQQILGLLGPNGAGKTTTLRALMGLISPDAGTITIFGRQVHAGSPALSRLGAFVEGPGFLPHLSGRANLDLYWRSTGRPADGAHLAGVLEIAGLGPAADKPVRTYSRGMCQRLAIAQAMLGLPDLLVLDEPMNGLDPPQIRQMRDVLTRYAEDGRTVILSSHMLAEVELTCTDVVVMHQGRRIAAGKVADIAGSGDAVVIGTPDPGQARAVLAADGRFESAEARPDGVVLRLGGQPASAAVAVLVAAGLEVDRVMPHRRLEDAFLALISGGPGGTADGLAGLADVPAEATP